MLALFLRIRQSLSIFYILLTRFFSSRHWLMWFTPLPWRLLTKVKDPFLSAPLLKPFSSTWRRRVWPSSCTRLCYYVRSNQFPSLQSRPWSGFWSQLDQLQALVRFAVPIFMYHYLCEKNRIYKTNHYSENPWYLSLFPLILLLACFTRRWRIVWRRRLHD